MCLVIACKASCMPFISSWLNISLFFSHLLLVVAKDWWTLLREQMHLEALATSFFQAATLSLAAFRAAFAASSSLPHLAALFPGCFATAASPSLGILQTSSSSIGMATVAVVAVVAVVAAVAVVVLPGCTDFPFTLGLFQGVFLLSQLLLNTSTDLIVIDDKLRRRPGLSPHLGLQEGMTKAHSIFQAVTPLHAIAQSSGKCIL